MPDVPRWSSGQLLLGGGGLARLPRPPPNKFQKLPGHPGCPGRRSRGPGQDCTVLCGRSCLRKPPGPAGGSGVGDCPRQWARYYKHCSCLQSDSPGPCLEGAPLGQAAGALVWTGLLCGVPQGQCFSWREQGLDQQVFPGGVGVGSDRKGSGVGCAPVPGSGTSIACAKVLGQKSLSSGFGAWGDRRRGGCSRGEEARADGFYKEHREPVWRH